MWTPKPILGAWTPDQARIAHLFPASRRVEVTAANGVGKTFLAADLAVSFLEQPNALVLTTAPTQRQVEELLWPHIWERLFVCGLADPQRDHAAAKWTGPQGQQARGFATNRAPRLQGFHAAKMLIIVDEASGVPAPLLEAIEGCALAAENYVFAIGNPNAPTGAFYELQQNPNWTHAQLSALTHPNIVQKREVIPGATTYLAFTDHLRDWCRETDTATNETFGFEGKTYLPNDAFRVRFLGVYPRQAVSAIFNAAKLIEATTLVAYSGGPCTAALDVARTGGDRTVYSLRKGNAVICLVELPAADLLQQAEAVADLLARDLPRVITIDAAGLGIGLIDELRRLIGPQGVRPLPVGIREFQGAGEPISPNEAKRYLNRRAVAYAHLATGVNRGQISLPVSPDLLGELQRITVQHKPDGRMVVVSKDQLKAMGFRSPDLADSVSMLFENPVSGGWFAQGDADGLHHHTEEW